MQIRTHIVGNIALEKQGVAHYSGSTTYHSVACDWFGRGKSSRAGHIASGAFLEMDAVFDPGKRHVIEARQEQGVEILQDKPK